MGKYTLCPDCRMANIQALERTIQEIDPLQLVFRAPETLTELKCEECGWFASATIPLGALT